MPAFPKPIRPVKPQAFSSFARKPMPEKVRQPAQALTRIVNTARITVEVKAVPKSPKPVRDEEYRRLVAGLECFHCRVHGHSQAAHPNTGKAKGVKLDDLDCFPMCHVGARDCHTKFDQYKLVPKGDEMQAFERAAKHWTVRELLHRGLWPMRLAIPDLRYFNA